MLLAHTSSHHTPLCNRLFHSPLHSHSHSRSLFPSHSLSHFLPLCHHCLVYITFELQSTPASTVCTARNTLHLRRCHAQRHPPLLLQTHSQRQTRAALYRDRDGVHQVSANGGLFPPRAVLPSRVLDRCDELLC